MNKYCLLGIFFVKTKVKIQKEFYNTGDIIIQESFKFFYTISVNNGKN